MLRKKRRPGGELHDFALLPNMVQHKGLKNTHYKKKQ
jgi:hypothetical protein